MCDISKEIQIKPVPRLTGGPGGPAGPLSSDKISPAPDSTSLFFLLLLTTNTSSSYIVSVLPAGSTLTAMSGLLTNRLTLLSLSECDTAS